MPKGRNDFDPVLFQQQVFGTDDKIEILNSNKLPPAWEKIISQRNPKSRYNWDKLDDMREDEDCDDDNEDDNDEESDCSLPKCVLRFTTLKLLKLFAKSERGSLNGTFKSCCKLWKQQFVFMLKFKKHWIPVIWGWLPDKTEISYKVRLLFTFLTGIMQCSHKWNVFSFHDL